METEPCFFCGSESDVEPRSLEYAGSVDAADAIPVPVCGQCWGRISSGAWEAAREGDLIKLRDQISGELISRRLVWLPSFSEQAYESSLQHLETSYQYILTCLEGLQWAQMERLMRLTERLSEYAWKIRAFCVAEALNRMPGGLMEKYRKVGLRFRIHERQVRYYRKIAETFRKEQVLSSKLGEQFFIKAAESSDPQRWIKFAEDQKTENPSFSSVNLRKEIQRQGLLAPASKRTRPDVPFDNFDIADLQALHADLLSSLLRKSLLRRLNSMEPAVFQNFVGYVLLPALGFQEVKVTGRPGDGGVDARGTLKLSYPNVKAEFQVKRLPSSDVPSSDIRDFRGSLRPAFHTAIFITTSDFTYDARVEAKREGVEPIELWSGSDLVQRMIDKGIGVKKGNLPLKQVDEKFFTKFLPGG